MASEERVFEPGDIIAGRYEIVEELGRGAYGVVFRAIQLGIGRPVALKTLLPQMAVDSEEHQRFEREAMAVSRLNHPNIITLFDYGEFQGVYFMVMEYVEGRSLGELIAHQAPVDPALARTLVYQMLDALQYAHDRGVVHRDLKPENIRLLKDFSPEGVQRESIKILDFGIAKFIQGDSEGSPMDTLTQTGIALGTPQYMSPENISGDPVTHHADLYAAALILYEMLVGEPAFTGATPHMVMVSHIKDDPPRLPQELSAAGFSRAIDWALQKQPDERVPSARVMREVLEEDDPAFIAGGKGSEAASASLASPTKALVAIALAATVVIVLLVLVVLMERDPVVKLATPQVENESMEFSAMDPVESTPEEEVDEVDELVFEVEDELFIDEFDEPPPSEEPVVQWRERPVRVAQEQSPRQESGTAVKEEPEAAQITLRITTDPDGARVSLNGAPIGTSPITRQLPRTKEALELGFSMIGYRDKVVQVVPDEDRAVDVRLERGRLELVP